MAITAISLGFVGILFAPIQIGTIVVAHLALGDIKKQPNLKGRGMAITALVIGYLYIAIIATCVVIAVSNQIWHWAG